MTEKGKALLDLEKWGIGVSIIGILDSGYLSWIKLTQSVEKCIPGLGDCATVNASKFSLIYGIPVAYLGLAAYIIVLILFLIKNPGIINRTLKSYAIFGITFAGFLFSAYLTYVQFGILKTYCPFCIVSAFTTTLLFIISIKLLISDNQSY